MRLRDLLGRNIRLFREKRGLTQEELATKAGINRTYLGLVERGKGNIGVDNIEKIATALDVNPYILFQLNLDEEH